MKRLGSGLNDAVEIKSHYYFSNVNWQDIYEKFLFYLNIFISYRKITPPTPELKMKM